MELAGDPKVSGFGVSVFLEFKGRRVLVFYRILVQPCAVPQPIV
jgi:hypothetical protein